jgi:hypothetical protein
MPTVLSILALKFQSILDLTLCSSCYHLEVISYINAEMFVCFFFFVETDC